MFFFKCGSSDDVAKPVTRNPTFDANDDLSSRKSQSARPKTPPKKKKRRSFRGCDDPISSSEAEVNDAASLRPPPRPRSASRSRPSTPERRRSPSENTFYDQQQQQQQQQIVAPEFSRVAAQRSTSSHSLHANTHSPHSRSFRSSPHHTNNAINNNNYNININNNTNAYSPGGHGLGTGSDLRQAMQRFVPYHVLSEEEALRLSQLLNAQRGRYGVHMFEAMQPSDQPQIQVLMSAGRRYEDAVFVIFDSRYNSGERAPVPPLRRSSSGQGNSLSGGASVVSAQPSVQRTNSGKNLLRTYSQQSIGANSSGRSKSPGTVKLRAIQRA